jgi:hypothetical protein
MGGAIRYRRTSTVIAPTRFGSVSALLRAWRAYERRKPVGSTSWRSSRRSWKRAGWSMLET